MIPKEKKYAIRDYFTRNRVSFGLLLGSGVFVFCRPGPHEFILIGLSISFLGLLTRSWAAGCIKKSKSLCTEGPYALVRHPLYLGSFLMSAGIVVAFSGANSIWLSGIFWAIYILYFWAFYRAAVTSEEKLLAERFSDRWADYKTNVPAFIPVRLDQIKNLSFESFSLAQFKKNREYNAVLGWTAIAVFVLILSPLPSMRFDKSSEAELTSKDPSPSFDSVAKLIPEPKTVTLTRGTLVGSQLHPNRPDRKTDIQSYVENEPAQTKQILLVEDDNPLEEFDSSPRLSLMNPWLGTAVLGTAALGLFDERIRSNVQHMVGEPIGQSFKDAGGNDRPLDNLGNLSTGLGISAGFYAVGSFAHSNRAKRVGVIGVQALVTNGFLTEMIGHGVGRKAPSESDADGFHPLQDNASFPSPQTSSAFTLASVVASEYDSIWVDGLSYGLASAVGFSRLSEDQHWASDVVGGALLGIVVGKSVSHFERKKGWSKRLYTNGRSVTYKQRF